MHGIKSLIVVALAATASASYFNGELLRRELLQARATSPSNSSSIPTATASSNSSSNACSSVLKGLATLITGLPTPTGALSTFLATAATTLTDPCHLTVPSSISSAFTAYESSVISFYSVHSSQLNSALAACPSLTNLVHNPVCSTSAAGVATTKTATETTPTLTAAPTATAPGTSSAPPKTSSAQAVSTAGANGNPRETGIVAGVMVAAGLLGAVAVAL